MKAGKNMKKALLSLAGIGLVSLFSTTANAAFVISETHTTASGNDTYVIRALNNGTGGTGTKLNGMTINVQTVDAAGQPISTGGAFKFDMAGDISGDGVNDPNIFGGSPTGATRAFGSALGTFGRIGTPANWSGPASGQQPQPYDSDPDGDGIPNSDPSVLYGNLHLLHIEGVTLGPADANVTAQPFFNIVVPMGLSSRSLVHCWVILAILRRSRRSLTLLFRNQDRSR